MEFQRSAGILLHPTSLPGDYGIGDLGPNAYKFIDFLEDAGQTLWQVFPLGPTGYGDSPYQCLSDFAGNYLLVSIDLLIEDDLLTKEDLKDYPSLPDHNVDFGNVIIHKTNLLNNAFNNFKSHGTKIEKEYEEFCEKNKDWLDNFCLFISCKQYHNNKAWYDWLKDIALYESNAVEVWKEKLKDKIEFHKFLQFTFDKQWRQLKKYANNKNIKIIGDLPIFIAYDSADLWANKNLFSVDDNGMLETVAGVPPDYFSETGQLWGNPLYRWKIMEKDDFLWHRKRFARRLELVDIIRLDHFRGYDAYWEIPSNAPTAVTGRWIKGPGEKFFKVLKKYLGDIPILAEDLGVITKSVRDLRDKFSFPGMKILQFAFGDKGDKSFLPHNLVKNCLVFTGSHDNDTTKGFFEKEKELKSGIYEWAQKYLGYFGNDIRFELIRTAYASIADFVMIPMQDILNLGSEARMNFPSRPSGN